MAEMDSAEAVQSEISTTDRIEVLKQKHASLETALEDENNRPMPDSSVVVNLKRENLRLRTNCSGSTPPKIRRTNARPAPFGPDDEVQSDQMGR